MRPYLPLLVPGLALVIAALGFAAWMSSPDTTAALNCSGYSDTEGCITQQPVVYTLMSTAQRALPALIPAGLAAIALSIGLASPTALTALRSPSPATERRPMTNRSQLVLRVLGGVLVVVALGAMVMQSRPDAMNYGMSCDDSGCTASPGYSVSVFLQFTTPGLLLGGLLTLVIAVAVRALAGRTAHPEPSTARSEGEATDPTTDDELIALFDPAEAPAATPPGLGALRPRARRQDLSAYMRPAERDE